MTFTDPATTPTMPVAEPQRIADDTYLIPNLVPAEPGTYVFVNTLVILAEEPIVVDTGAPLHRERWLDAVSSIVDPADVRWVFLSHDDGDHLGNMPAARPGAQRQGRGQLLQQRAGRPRARPRPARSSARCGWRKGTSFDAGDRRLHLFRPPIFDGPTTRGLYDERTGVMWAVDSFAALTVGAVYEAADLPSELYDETFALFNSMISPWHQWLDPTRYARHVDAVEAIGPSTIASAHGPVLRGPFIAGAFDRVRAMAGQPIVPPPGQETLDALVAQALIVG